MDLFLLISMSNSSQINLLQVDEFVPIVTNFPLKYGTKVLVLLTQSIPFPPHPLSKFLCSFFSWIYQVRDFFVI